MGVTHLVLVKECRTGDANMRKAANVTLSQVGAVLASLPVALPAFLATALHRNRSLYALTISCVVLPLSTAHMHHAQVVRVLCRQQLVPE